MPSKQLLKPVAGSKHKSLNSGARWRRSKEQWKHVLLTNDNPIISKAWFKLLHSRDKCNPMKWCQGLPIQASFPPKNSSNNTKGNSSYPLEDWASKKPNPKPSKRAHQHQSSTDQSCQNIELPLGQWWRPRLLLVLSKQRMDFRVWQNLSQKNKKWNKNKINYQRKKKDKKEKHKQRKKKNRGWERKY